MSAFDISKDEMPSGAPERSAGGALALCDLPKDTRARIASIVSADAGLEAKLREIGFAEDDEVEILHFGPLGRRPICVRLNETLVALRPPEAAAIRVEMIG